MKPEGYSTVSPYLVVEDAQQLIDFLEEVFGAVERRRYDLPDGSIMHGEVQIDDTVIMIADGNDLFPPFSSLLHVYVDDVDAVYKKAVAAGATPVEQPQQREGDPDRRGSFEDPAGNTWSVATQIEK